MDIRTLRNFIVVAHEENVTCAAELVHISQPTLSRQIKLLEDEVGTPLLERGHRSVSLTPAGSLFYRRAQEIVALADRAVDEVGRRSGEFSGVVIVGVSGRRAADRLCRMAAEFQRAYPLVRFDLRRGNAEDLAIQLSEGVVDAILVPDAIEIARTDFYELEDKERWGALVHESHPLAVVDAIHPGDLVGTRVVTVQGDALVQNMLMEWSGAHARRMDWLASYSSVLDAAAYARERKGAAICQDCGFSFPGLRFVPFEPALEQDMRLVWRTDRIQPEHVAAFLNGLSA